MHIHFVAVAGTGMGALAGLFRAMGHDVTGSDVAFDPPIGPELEGWGIRCLRGFDPAHLEPRPDLVVVGNVCRRDNVEACAALERGIPITSMPQALHRFALADEHGVTPAVVAGTHGKTTTSALLAFLLESIGQRPGFLIGGLPKNFDTSFRPAGDGRTSDPGQSAPRRNAFVVEGDEYDSAFFEKTPKFWHYGARVAIVTSIEHDHIDIYPTEASYLAAFEEFVRRIPPDGMCVAAAFERHVVDIVRSCCRAEVIYYALSGDDTFGISPTWMAAPAPFEDGMQAFDLFVGGVLCGRLRMPIPGQHNIRNAVAALAAAQAGFGGRLPDLGAALSRFQGVRRRQDLLGVVRGVSVYDDFAHHPTAVDETLRALRGKHPSGRLFAVFEPRSATACRALHQAAYAQAFGAADRVILAPLGRANVPAHERLDVPALVSTMRGAGCDAEAAPSVDAILSRLATEVRPGDVVALLSNGAFGGIHRRLLEVLAQPSHFA